MQCQEKMKKNKQPEGKTKKKTPEEIGAETRMRRHIHRLKPVSSEEINFLLFFWNYQEATGAFKKRQEYKMFGKKSQVAKICCRTSWKQEVLITLWGPEWRWADEKLFRGERRGGWGDGTLLKKATLKEDSIIWFAQIRRKRFSEGKKWRVNFYSSTQRVRETKGGARPHLHSQKDPGSASNQRLRPV